MSTWGPGLYQSDIDLEMLDLITDEAVRLVSDPECLRSSLMPDSFTLRAPIDRISTIQQLEDGLLHRLVRQFNHQKNQAAIVILGVVCMELGVRIAPEDMLSMMIALMKWDANRIKKDQVCQAFELYQNNGAVWTFDGKRAVEVPLSPLLMTAEANQQEVRTVLQEPDAGDGTLWKRYLPGSPHKSQYLQQTTDMTPAPTLISSTSCSTHYRARSHTTTRAKNNASLTELEKILPQSGSTSNIAACVPALLAPQPKKEGPVTSWLASSGSQLHFDRPKDSTIDTRKPGECMFTLPVPARGSSKAAVTPTSSNGAQLSQSMYRLPGPPRKDKGAR
ncbi:MAG: hypothetical protein Q9204_006011 [Flavoplaca sp. TL-2023a]